MAEFATIFLALIVETTPFLLAGVLISVLAGPAVERVLAGAASRAPGVALLAGAGAGMLLPMCDCGSRPLAHRLALAGRREFAFAFLVAAPVLNPIVLVTTWLAFRDASFVALRLGVTLIMALVAGMVVARFNGPVALPNSGMEHDHGAAGGAARVLDEFFGLFQFLVVGSALAAGIQVFVDTSALSSGEGVYLAIAAMMLLAFLLSICSSVDAFVVAGLGGATGLGPALAFLTFGPLMNLKSLPMYMRLFSAPVVVALALIVGQLSFVAAVTAELRAW